MTTSHRPAPVDGRPVPAVNRPGPAPDTTGPLDCGNHTEMLAWQRAADVPASAVGMWEWAAAAGAQRIAHTAATVKTEALAQAAQAERLELHFAQAVGDALTADQPPLPRSGSTRPPRTPKSPDALQITAQHALAVYELASVASDLALSSARAAAVFELATAATARTLTDAVAQHTQNTALESWLPPPAAVGDDRDRRRCGGGSR